MKELMISEVEVILSTKNDGEKTAIPISLAHVLGVGCW